jgi:hypothetical protein
MVTRPVRDPEVHPTMKDLERELARAMVVVWDSETIAVVGAALTSSILNAESFADRHGLDEAYIDATRLRRVLLFLQETELARGFLLTERAGTEFPTPVALWYA